MARPTHHRLSLSRGTDSFSDLHTDCPDATGKRNDFQQPKANTAAAAPRTEHPPQQTSSLDPSSVADFGAALVPRGAGPDGDRGPKRGHRRRCSLSRRSGDAPAPSRNTSQGYRDKISDPPPWARPLSHPRGGARAPGPAASPSRPAGRSTGRARPVPSAPAAPPGTLPVPSSLREGPSPARPPRRRERVSRPAGCPVQRGVPSGGTRGPGPRYLSHGPGPRPALRSAPAGPGRLRSAGPAACAGAHAWAGGEPSPAAQEPRGKHPGSSAGPGQPLPLPSLGSAPGFPAPAFARSRRPHSALLHLRAGRMRGGTRVTHARCVLTSLRRVPTPRPGNRGSGGGGCGAEGE